MYNDTEEMNELLKIMEDMLSPEDQAAIGMAKEDDSALRAKIHSLVEHDMGSQTLTPLARMQDKKTLYPWAGKESDSELAFNFEDIMDAQSLYDFVLNTGLVEAGEVRMHVSGHQTSVHFAPHVMVIKPEVIQAALMAYEEFMEEDDDNYEAYEAIADEIEGYLEERTKVSGAPKGRGKGNPFHDKNTGKFSGADSISGKKGGSFVKGKTKLKYAGDKKSKSGDKVVNFASTKRPCGRKARRDGKDVRCWDGKKGKGFGESIANVMIKQIDRVSISDEDIKSMLESIESITDMAERSQEEGWFAIAMDSGKVYDDYALQGDGGMYTGTMSRTRDLLRNMKVTGKGRMIWGKDYRIKILSKKDYIAHNPGNTTQSDLRKQWVDIDVRKINFIKAK